MKKIINPFNDGGNPCFACSSKHPSGLHMEFYEDGDELVCFWEPGTLLQGFPGILHGGIQATLMDEIASWTVFIKGETAGVTSTMHIEYRKPAVLNKGKITLRSRVKSTDRNRMTLHTRLINAQDELCSEGEIIYFIYPGHIARRKFNYPGIEALWNRPGNINGLLLFFSLLWTIV